MLKKSFATKKDLDTLVNKKDLKKQLVNLKSEIVGDILKHLDKNFVTKQEFEELKKKIDHLPNKEEFFNKMDEVIGEYKAFEQERDTLLRQLN